MVLSIIVRFTFSGIHHWPGAPQDVEEQYLVVPHRHLFHVEAVKAVTHEERDIEFIALQRQMINDRARAEEILRASPRPEGITGDD